MEKGVFAGKENFLEKAFLSPHPYLSKTLSESFLNYNKKTTLDLEMLKVERSSILC